MKLCSSDNNYSVMLQQKKNIQDNRVRISGLHFAKCEDILSLCEALFQSNNKNAKLSISFLAPKFLLLTIIFKQDNVLQKHLIS